MVYYRLLNTNGLKTSETGTQTVNLPVQFSNTDYFIIGGNEVISGVARRRIKTKTTGSFTTTYDVKAWTVYDMVCIGY